jgi:hypothetical protein
MEYAVPELSKTDILQFNIEHLKEWRSSFIEDLNDPDIDNGWLVYKMNSLIKSVPSLAPLYESWLAKTEESSKDWRSSIKFLNSIISTLEKGPIAK